MRPEHLSQQMASLIERLKFHQKDLENRNVHPAGLIEEAHLALVQQSGEIADLKVIMDRIEGALCNFINNCEDPYEPEAWLKAIEHDFKELTLAYNAWHEESRLPWDITYEQYKIDRERMLTFGQELLSSLYPKMKNVHDKRLIEDAMIRLRAGDY